MHAYEMSYRCQLGQLYPTHSCHILYIVAIFIDNHFEYLLQVIKNDCLNL
jgi:hypothetical protein